MNCTWHGQFLVEQFVAPVARAQSAKKRENAGKAAAGVEQFGPDNDRRQRTALGQVQVDAQVERRSGSSSPRRGVEGSCRSCVATPTPAPIRWP